jgi:hypothetical protein
VIIAGGFSHISFSQAQDPTLDLAKLKDAYPQQIVGSEGNNLIWRDGERMVLQYSAIDRPLNQVLKAPLLGDMFRFHYPKRAAATVPQMLHDPGRIRYESFFTKMYGDCRRGGVRTRKVAWLPAYQGGHVNITTTNDVDQALERVMAELSTLPREVMKYLVPQAGGYNCREIAGTNRLSAHSFGISIDINIKFANYWKWDAPNFLWKNSVPIEIVSIFEKHGFIWGGRWHHYDTMHFEYRPELLR